MSLLVSSLTAPPGGAGDSTGAQVGGIAERIASAISLGMLAVGERLPPEAELAGQFSIAVATLRKALATLRARGVVETRRGRNGGTFVIKAPFPESDMIRDALRATSIVALRDFADEHSAISGAAARLATERTPTGHATRLAELAFRAREASDGQERSMTDSRFHIEVAVLSHSPRLLAAEQRLQAEGSPFLWCDAISRYSPHLAFTDHLALTMAIEQGRSSDAQRLSEEHVVRGVRRIIEAKLLLPPVAQMTPARTDDEEGAP